MVDLYLPATLATVDFDYTSVSSDVVFMSGSTDGDTRCVDITIEDDEALEINETFTLALTSSDPNVMFGQDMTTVIIVDNDGWYLAHLADFTEEQIFENHCF